MLAPFLWMLSLSFKAPDEIFMRPITLWPRHFYGLENYRLALTTVPFARFMLNGAFVAACVLALQIVVAAPCA
jgi:multiple sugar transport system permease protein